MDLTTLLQELDRRREWYRIERHRVAIMVVVHPPGEYWEIEFMDEGGIEIERFRSNGVIGDERLLDDLWPLTE
jgi:hypothetical protein